MGGFQWVMVSLFLMASGIITKMSLVIKCLNNIHTSAVAVKQSNSKNHEKTIIIYPAHRREENDYRRCAHQPERNLQNR
jgi:hypothetical protein